MLNAFKYTNKFDCKCGMYSDDVRVKRQNVLFNVLLNVEIELILFQRWQVDGMSHMFPIIYNSYCTRLSISAITHSYSLYHMYKTV